MILILVFIPQAVSIVFSIIWQLRYAQDSQYNTKENSRIMLSVEVSFVFILGLIRLSEPLVWYSLREAFYTCLGNKNKVKQSKRMFKKLQDHDESNSLVSFVNTPINYEYAQMMISGMTRIMKA